MNSIFVSGSFVDRSLIQKLILFCIGFFLLTSVLTAFFIIPKLNSQIESEYSENLTAKLELEAKLFNNYLDSKRTVLLDLSSLPSLAHAVLMSDATDQNLINLIDNIVIGGKKGRVVLQDVAGTVLIKSSFTQQGQYRENSNWVNKLVEGDIPYYFKLLGQNEDQLFFQLSVPILYKGLAEGVLSAEISTSLSEIFVAQSYQPVAFRLKQGPVVVNTDISHIAHARETSKYLKDADTTFTYIIDDSIVAESKHSLRNTILVVLLASLGISFLMFVLVEYLRLIHSNSEVIRYGRVYVIPITIALVGVAASLTAFIIIKDIQNESSKKGLVADSKIQVLGIQQEISNNINILRSTKAYFEASQFVDREEFGLFSSRVKANNTSIEKLLWAPKVSLADRDKYERHARSGESAHFSIKELETSSVPASTSFQDHYFPTAYVEPLQDNEALLGLDIAFNNDVLSIMERGGASNQTVAFKPAVSARVHRDKTQPHQTEMFILSPVYNYTNANLIESRYTADALRGFAVLSLNVEDLVSASLRNDGTVIGMHIQDITDLDSPISIYGSTLKSSDYSYNETFSVAGRIWHVDIELEAPPSSMWWVSWAIVLFGLTLTALTTVWLIHLIQRREVVEALATKLGALNLIIANSNDVFMTIEAGRFDQKCKFGKIAFVNSAFTKLTGYSSNEAIGNSPSILFGEDPENRLLELPFMEHSTEEPFVGELKLFRKNNDYFWADINISPITDAGGVNVQYAVVIRDISERIRADEEREKLIGKLTDSNEELERFAFVCSHDLQEPLRMIRSFSEKLQGHIGEDLKNDDKGSKYFHFIIDGAERAQILITDILAYSSINGATKSTENISIDELVEKINQDISEFLHSKGGSISYDNLPEIRGNKTQVYQVFQNLINNALKYQLPDAAPHVHIGVQGGATHWTFAIRDNGIGMKQKHLNKIFDVFQRLHRKDQYAGTGVGLSICKKIIERHGGKLWVESEHGVGSVFYFTLLKCKSEGNSYEQQRKAS